MISVTSSHAAAAALCHEGGGRVADLLGSCNAQDAADTCGTLAAVSAPADFTPTLRGSDMTLHLAKNRNFPNYLELTELMARTTKKSLRLFLSSG
jgi:hypothetical protein